MARKGTSPRPVADGPHYADLREYLKDLASIANEAATRSEEMGATGNAARLRDDADRLREATSDMLTVIAQYDSIVGGKLPAEPALGSGKFALISALGAALSIGARGIENPDMQTIRRKLENTARTAEANRKNTRMAEQSDSIIRRQFAIARKDHPELKPTRLARWMDSAANKERQLLGLGTITRSGIVKAIERLGLV